MPTSSATGVIRSGPPSEPIQLQPATLEKIAASTQNRAADLWMGSWARVTAKTKPFCELLLLGLSNAHSTFMIPRPQRDSNFGQLSNYFRLYVEEQWAWGLLHRISTTTTVISKPTIASPLTRIVSNRPAALLDRPLLPLPHRQRGLRHTVEPGQHQNRQQRVLWAEISIDRFVPFVARVPVAALPAAADCDGGNAQ